jgi:aspartate-semialdehyde dehydrogenase
MAARSGEHPKLAIVGASGTVGGQLAELLGQRDFTYAELKLFAAPASARTKPILADEPGPEVIELESPADLVGCDVVFLATPAAPAAAILAACPASIQIDLSAANRVPTADQPLVAPGLTSRERVLELRPKRAFGIPHPAAQIIAAVLRTLGIDAEFVGATVLLGASGAGREAIATLFNQSADLLNARLDLADDETQTAFNLFLPEDADELAGAIAAQVAELRRKPHALAVQVARAPIFHGAAVAIFLPYRIDFQQWAARLREAPGLILVESGEASGTVEAAGQEAVIVKLTASRAGATLWCVFDAARVAALSAIWVAETVSA